MLSNSFVGSVWVLQNASPKPVQPGNRHGGRQRRARPQVGVDDDLHEVGRESCDKGCWTVQWGERERKPRWVLCATRLVHWCGELSVKLWTLLRGYCRLKDLLEWWKGRSRRFSFGLEIRRSSSWTHSTRKISKLFRVLNHSFLKVQGCSKTVL